MREGVRIPESLRASGHALPVISQKGAIAETARALKAWTAKHPNPCVPRARRAAGNLPTTHFIP